MCIEPWTHQLAIAEEAYEILQKNAIVYLSMEERTGKSLTAILVAEMADIEKVLIVTKKKPLASWNELLADFPHDKLYQTSTYHQLKHINDDDWDLVILDESHNYISSFPEAGKAWNHVRRKTLRTPIIYLSATPCAQTPAQLYHQFALSDWSPWRTFSNYKNWHKVYGIPYTKWLYKREVDMWDQVQDDRVFASCQHLFISYSRQELGFKHEPKDQVHYIPLTDETKQLYNEVMKHKVLLVEETEILCDVLPKLRSTLHMLEGGTAKETLITLNGKGNPVTKGVSHMIPTVTEKIDYIKEAWGDSKHIAIMYNYIAEKIKLEQAFDHALILQATSFAEGVDLSHIEHLIIYSQDFSTARHTQRRARQANLRRKTPITVHFLLVKNAISEEVYNCVSINKRNYVDRFFNGVEL